jgi:hypothetical protein
MYPVPFFFYREKMPYFQIRIAQNISSEYIVLAPNRETAEDRALMADVGKKFDKKQVMRLRTDSSGCIDIADSDKAAWDEALTKQKET